LQNDIDNWIIQAQHGKKEAFSQLVEAYNKQVYSLCYRMLGNLGDAEDASQETFLRAYKAMKRFDRDRNFITWLLSIAANYCIDQRRKRRLPTLSIEDAPYIQVPDNRPGIEKMVTVGEENQEVHQMLGILNPKDRAAVIFFYWYDYSYEEIAAAISVTTSAVKSRLHRARREMAAAWTQAKTQPVLLERTQHETPTI
jgi:RNA polymerase sigma-70 factor (ECF subfamily)